MVMDRCSYYYTGNIRITYAKAVKFNTTSAIVKVYDSMELCETDSTAMFVATSRDSLFPVVMDGCPQQSDSESSSPSVVGFIVSASVAGALNSSSFGLLLAVVVFLLVIMMV